MLRALLVYFRRPEIARQFAVPYVTLLIGIPSTYLIARWINPEAANDPVYHRLWFLLLMPAVCVAIIHLTLMAAVVVHAFSNGPWRAASWCKAYSQLLSTRSHQPIHDTRLTDPPSER